VGGKEKEKGKGRGGGGRKERGRDLLDQCQTTSYAPARIYNIFCLTRNHLDNVFVFEHRRQLSTDG